MRFPHPLLVVLIALVAGVATAVASISVVADLDSNATNGPDTLQAETGDTVLVRVWITGAGDSLVSIGITLGDTTGALVWVEEDADSIYTTPAGWAKIPGHLDSSGRVLIQAVDFGHSTPLVLPSQVAEVKFTVAPGESCGTVGWDPEESGWMDWGFTEAAFAAVQTSALCVTSLLDGGEGASGSDGETPGGGTDTSGVGVAGGIPSGITNARSVQGQGACSYPTWSPDGRKIMFFCDDGVGIAFADSLDRARIISTGFVNPYRATWTLDGNSAVFISKIFRPGDDPPVRFRVSRVDLPALSVSTIAEGDGRAGHPAATESGIVFSTSLETRVTHIGLNGRSQELPMGYGYVFQRNDGNIYLATSKGISALTVDGRENQYYDPLLSPSGDLVLCSGTGGFYVMDATDGSVKMIHEGFRPSWHPGGEWIIYSVVHSGHYDIESADLYAIAWSSGAVRRLTDTVEAREIGAEFSPDGRKVVFESGGSVWLGEVVYE
jgi:hypothetical protein